MQRYLVGVVSREDGELRPGQLRREEADERCLEQVGVEHVDPLAPESHGESQGRERIQPAALRAQREGGYPDLPQAFLQPAGTVERTHLHLEAAVVRVPGDQPEVPRRLGVRDEVDDADRGVDVASRSQHWVSSPDVRAPSCRRT